MGGSGEGGEDIGTGECESVVDELVEPTEEDVVIEVAETNERGDESESAEEV